MEEKINVEKMIQPHKFEHAIIQSEGIRGCVSEYDGVTDCYLHT